MDKNFLKTLSLYALNIHSMAIIHDSAKNYHPCYSCNSFQKHEVPQDQFPPFQFALQNAFKKTKLITSYSWIKKFPSFLSCLADSIPITHTEDKNYCMPRLPPTKPAFVGLRWLLSRYINFTIVQAALLTPASYVTDVSFRSRQKRNGLIYL